ncbi:MAG: uracil-DNA glycosylase [Clostridium sp.]
MLKFNNDWDNILLEEIKKEYFMDMLKKVENEYKVNTVYPQYKDIFNAFRYTSFSNISVVILGQDPYHGANQAHGLSFSVNRGIKIPPSLKNIYKELKNDLGCYIPNNGYLKNWADQGVLLLNTTLTVKEATPNSHKNIGWTIFTDNVISMISERDKPVVFILWGKFAQDKECLIKGNHHLIIKSPHPSPLSARRGFLGSKPFSKVNEFLKLNNIKEIDWQIENI